MRLVNFWDLGGLPLLTGGTFPRGRLYRSGTLDLLTQPETVELAANLGIATVIDLRSPSERQFHHRFPDEVGVLEIPFLSDMDPEWERPTDQSTRATAHRYLDMLERQGKDSLPAIITALTADRFPLVIHCTAGKDRTGIVTALLMTLAGVTDEAIARDYARARSLLRYQATDPATAGSSTPDPQKEHDTSPKTMRLFLDGVKKRYQSVEGLAIASNVRNADLQQARIALLMPHLTPDNPFS